MIGNKRLVFMLLTICCLLSFCVLCPMTSFADDYLVTTTDYGDYVQSGASFFVPRIGGYSVYYESIIRKYDNGILYGFGATFGEDYYTCSIITYTRAWGGTVTYKYEPDDELDYMEWYSDLKLPEDSEHAPKRHYIYMQEDSYSGNNHNKAEFRYYLLDEVPSFAEFNNSTTTIGGTITIKESNGPFRGDYYT